MSDRDGLIAAIDGVFTADHPGDAFLQGSFEGCEPFDEVGAFHENPDWRALEPGFLDEHASALSFFSEAGLRYYLPAYLVADVRGELRTADPLFHLVHGFSEFALDVPAGTAAVRHRSGGRALLGPRRYGAMTWDDASRHRLSVFCREEAAVIVAYLEFRRASDEHDIEAPRIDAALSRFWRDRAREAPTRAELDRHG
jgi:hypothetical protein